MKIHFAQINLCLLKLIIKLVLFIFNNQFNRKFVSKKPEKLKDSNNIRTFFKTIKQESARRPVMTSIQYNTRLILT